MASWTEYFAWTMFKVARKLRLTKLLRVGISTGLFLDYFTGFEKSRAVRGIFGDATDEVLRASKFSSCGSGTWASTTTMGI